MRTNDTIHFSTGLLRICATASAAVLFTLFFVAYTNVCEAASYSIDSCDSCHDSPPLDGPIRNSVDGSVRGNHQGTAHKGIASGTDLCAACHIKPTALSHRNGIISMNTTGIAGFTGAYYDKNLNNSYDGAPTDTGFQQSYAPTLGVCRNLYCHSNGKTGTSVEAYAAPQWGDEPTGACDICHGYAPGYPNGGAATESANSHGSHWSHPGMACSTCHNETTEDGTGIRADLSPNRHLNGIANIAFDSANPLATFDGTQKTCSNVACHIGDSPQWGDNSLWCGSCHGYDYHTTYGGKGTFQSHSTHTENDSDDIKGPHIACSYCHDTNDYPYFANGTDANSDGRYDLSETSVCDPCHSRAGFYNGVDSDGSSIGAKDNWSSGVYVNTASSELQSGKQRWCVGCHDTGADSIINGVTAPPVGGDEAASTNYSTGYGFYKTGHGLANTSTYPESGGLVSGAGADCDSCHDFSLAHIDGEPRTYLWNTTATDYRNGYRLALVNGSLPMNIPNKDSSYQTLKTTDYELCFKCHMDDYDALGVVDNTGTYFYDEAQGTGSKNLHQYHLKQANSRYASDWSSNVPETRISCVVCHNVHGTSNLAMIRDGSLTNRPGFEIWYNKDGMSFTYPGPPPSTDVTLAASNGVVWDQSTAQNYCTECHGPSGAYYGYYRQFPDVDIAPALGWSPYSGFDNGVDPDGGIANLTTFTFMVRFTDANDDAPSAVHLLVDTDDSDACNTPDAVYDMAEYDGMDTTYYNGKDYIKTLQLAKDEDNAITFCYNAASNDDMATGAPTLTNAPLAYMNAAPSTSWLGNVAGFVSDGVNPNQAATGTDFTFRIRYTDLNNDAPTEHRLLIDNGAIYNAQIAKLDTADNDYTDGVIYNATISIASEGAHYYRFVFTDSDGAAATGAGLTNSPLTVTSGTNTPVLSWTGEQGYTADGVSPDIEAEWLYITFRVKYTDADNDAPDANGVQVWVDKDNSSSYTADEKITMDGAEADDLEYSDGKIYTKKISMVFPGAGGTGSSLYPTYEFHATDLTSRVATTIGGTYGITNAIVVPDESATITLAANRSDALTNTVVVKAGTYAEYISPNPNKEVYIRSVEGPQFTTIINSGAAAPVYFNSDSGSLIQGFTIANSSTYGVYVQSTNNLVIEDCIIRNNASYGIYVLSGTPTSVLNTEIRNNTSRGIHVNGAYALNVEGSAISNNTYSGDGGGIYLLTGASMNLINSTVSGNAISGRGAGVFLNASNNINVINSTIASNSANTSGGALGICSTCTANVLDSTVSANIANTSGGGIWVNTAGTLNIANSVVSGNQSTTIGGGIHSLGIVNATNLMLTGNRASGSGGGIYDQGTEAYCLFCTISGNYSAVSGGGVYHLNATVNTYANSIIYNNAPHQIWSNIASPTTQLYYTLINQAATTNTYLDMGGNDIVNSAGFTGGLDPASAPTTGGDYHLSATSAAIDAASASFTAAEDIDGDARPRGAGYDMGADEYTGE